MQRQVLHPPNSQTFSETVIGNVMQRKWPMRHSFTADNSNLDLDRFAHQQQRLNPSENKTTHGVTTFVPNNIPNSNKLPGFKMSLEDIAAVTDQTTVDKLQMILKANRDCRRRIQIRYQNKKKRAFSELKDSIPQLREQVNELQRKFDDLSRKKETLWSVSVEYFRVFENGFSASSKNALNFLRVAIAPDVDTGVSIGLDGLIENWRNLTQLFPDIHTQLDGLARVLTDTVVATTTTAITITEKSLQDAFPHLVNDSKIQSERRERIVTKLLGQRILMRGSVRFDWDDSGNHVVRLYTQTDMLGPMLQLLGNLEDTSLLFSDALIFPDGSLKQ